MEGSFCKAEVRLGARRWERRLTEAQASVLFPRVFSRAGRCKEDVAFPVPIRRSTFISCIGKQALLARDELTNERSTLCSILCIMRVAADLSYLLHVK